MAVVHHVVCHAAECYPGFGRFCRALPRPIKGACSRPARSTICTAASSCCSTVHDMWSETPGEPFGNEVGKRFAGGFDVLIVWYDSHDPRGLTCRLESLNRDRRDGP